MSKNRCKVNYPIAEKFKELYGNPDNPKPIKKLIECTIDKEIESVKILPLEENRNTVNVIVTHPDKTKSFIQVNCNVPKTSEVYEDEDDKEKLTEEQLKQRREMFIELLKQAGFTEDNINSILKSIDE